MKLRKQSLNLTIKKNLITMVRTERRKDEATDKKPEQEKLGKDTAE